MAQEELPSSTLVMEELYELALEGVADRSFSPDMVRYLQKHYGRESDFTDPRQLWKVMITENTTWLAARASVTIEKKHLKPALPESSAFCPAPAAQLILKALRRKDFALFREGCRLLRAHRLHLHPLAIPGLLELSKDRGDLWALITLITGERATWLSGQVSQWSWFEALQTDTTNEKSTDTLPPEWLLLWRRQKHKAVHWDIFIALSSPAKDRVFNAVISNPGQHDLQLLLAISQGRSKQKSALAYAGLLRLDTDQRLEALAWAQTWKAHHLHQRQGQIGWTSPSETDIPFELLNRYWDSDYNTELLLALLPPATLLEDLALKPTEICRQIMTDPSLLTLAKTLLRSAAIHQDTTWLNLFFHFWLKHYPGHHTTDLTPALLFGKVHGELVNDWLKAILETDDEYQVEKMSILVDHGHAYFSRLQSEAAVQKLLYAIQKGMHRSDVKVTKSMLPAFAQRLDPRALSKVKQHWPESVLYYSSLSKPLWKFRSRLEERYELFTYLSDHK